MIKRLLATGFLTASLVLGVGAPISAASATPNGSQLANCLHNAADKLARRVQGNGNSASARRQFNRDVTRCHRRFG